ncbi:MAG TPA: hypothetical protein VFQ78_01050 [Candidatus Udaeobacter sp.]|nr:hypothetical protein [Candidatus Udaeobacter sp.]
MNQTKSPSLGERLLPWALATTALLCGTYALLLAIKLAHYPMQYDYEEGNILNAGLRIVHGLTPYPDPHGWPIILNPYGPLPYLITAALIKVFGITLVAPRIESIVCAALIVSFLFLLLRRSALSLTTSFGFGAMFLCNNSVRNWMLINRVDWVGLALTLAGLAVFLYFPKYTFAASFFFSAAILVKVSLLAAPAACCLYLVKERDWQQLLRFVIVGFALGTTGFLVTQSWASGHFFFSQFGSHPDAYRFSVYFMFLRLVAREFPLLAGLALCTVVLSLRNRTPSLSVLYLLAAVLGAATIGKAGSNTNHLLELYAALCWCAGCGWEVAKRWLREKNLPLASNAILVGVYLSILIPFVLYRPRIDDPSLCDKTYQFLRSHGNSVLTDNVGALLITGKPVLVSNPYVFSQLAMHAGWSDAPVVDRIRARQFDVILLMKPADKYSGPDSRFTPGMVRAIKQNYHVDAEFECLDAAVAYTPNATSDSASSSDASQ